ncbi:putative Glycos_transf_1 domain-containing protein [Candidatus Hydrogenisulfobacillus filiaventi]|uniref:Putative Glycos_transf_1 domain-containing protein n=1 Tax=Candidatus Hydrogenisulfobacillus filiaventi TaxID=2707344 RepID=A0A6F8ZDX5_9FIRM|nr:putative Glycos_transf_1 domain-containing protein [Candidatus Hydrogenisulfobacillus filiaventi]
MSVAAAAASVSTVWVLPHAGFDQAAWLASWAAPALAAEGMALTVVPMRPRPAGRAPLPPLPGVTVLDPPLGSGPLSGLAMTGLLRRILGQYDQVLVSQDLALEVAALTAARGLRRRGHLVLVAHLALNHLLSAQGEHRVGRLRAQLKKLYPTFDRVFTVSRAVTDDLHDEFDVCKGRQQVLTPPVPEDLKTARERPLPAGWPGDKGRPVTVTLGDLDVGRGVPVLLEAAARLAQQGRPLIVAVLGEGPERGALEARARELGLDAVFPSWPADWAAWLGHADLYVGPQYWDGAGLDYWAAMAAGVPAVGTDAPVAIREVTGGAAELVEIGEPEALAAAMAHVLDHPDLARRQVEFGRVRAAKAFASARQGWLEAAVKPFVQQPV